MICYNIQENKMHIERVNAVPVLLEKERYKFEMVQEVEDKIRQEKDLHRSIPEDSVLF